MNYTPLDIDRLVKSYLADDLNNMIWGVVVCFGFIFIIAIFKVL